MRKYFSPLLTMDTFWSTLWLRFKIGLYLALGIALAGTVAILPTPAFQALVGIFLAGTLIRVLLYGRLIVFASLTKSKLLIARLRLRNAKILASRKRNLEMRLREVIPEGRRLSELSTDELEEADRLLESIEELQETMEQEIQRAQISFGDGVQHFEDWEEYESAKQLELWPKKTAHHL